MSHQPRSLYSNAAEQSVLGGLLRAPRLLAPLFDRLREEDFYFDAHRKIFAVLRHFHDHDQECDAAMVYEELLHRKQAEDVGSGYLADLLDREPTGAVADYHAETVLDYSLRRRVIHKSTEFLRDVSETSEPARETIMRFVESMLDSEYQPHPTQDEPKSLSAALTTKLIEFDQFRQPDGKKPIPTGFVELDNVLGGLRAGELIYLGARPSVGKSALALNILMNAAQAGHPGLLFSLEMAETEVAARAIAAEGSIPLNRLTGSLADDEHVAKRIVDTAERMRNAPIWIDGRVDHTPSTIRSVARRAIQKHGVKLIVIDYLQLVRHEGTPKDSQYVRIGETSRLLKIMARMFGVPVICLSQLNRELENRADGRPRMSDLRESGNLEQDADVILLLWPDDRREEVRDTQEIRVVVDKQRNGPRCIVSLDYARRYTRFENRKII